MRHTCSRNNFVVVVGEGLVGIRCYKLIHILVLSVLQSKILICFAHFQIVDFRIQANNDGTNILIELAEICVAELFVVVFDSIAFNIDTLQFINDASFTNNIATQRDTHTFSTYIRLFVESLLLQVMSCSGGGARGQWMVLTNEREYVTISCSSASTPNDLSLLWNCSLVFVELFV